MEYSRIKFYVNTTFMSENYCLDLTRRGGYLLHLALQTTVNNNFLALVDGGGFFTDTLYYSL